MLSSVRYFSNSSLRRFPRITSLSQNAASRVSSFREQLATSKPVKSFGTAVPRPSIRNQILFATAASVGIYAWAADQTNKDTDKWIAIAREKSKILFAFGGPTNQDLRKLKKVQLVQELQGGYDRLMTRIQSFPANVKHNVSFLFVQGAQPFLDADEGKRMSWQLISLCATTWLLWKMPKAIPFMKKSFTHDPLSGRSYTLLTSMFSHQNVIHLGANSMALAACAGSVWFHFYQSQEKTSIQTGWREADSGWHCLAFFISAGLFSGLVSHVAHARWIFPRLISKVGMGVTKPFSAAATLSAEVKAASQKAADAIRPSIGISGAVYAGFVLTALAYPQALANIIFLPIFPIPIRWLTSAVVAFDVMGIVRGWQVFDHFAHLGGALFGVIYYKYGQQWWDWWRGSLLPPPDPTSTVKKNS